MVRVTSPSVRGRGSKHAGSCVTRLIGRATTVALRAGAWIETYQGTAQTGPGAQGRSPSVRGRGSKQSPEPSPRTGGVIASPSVRGRGSKPGAVRPSSPPDRPPSPSVRGRGSKHRPATRPVTRAACRPPCGGVDRNVHAIPVLSTLFTTGRPPCGGVDRNMIKTASGRGPRGVSRPPCGGVDRNQVNTIAALPMSCSYESPSVRGRGSKLRLQHQLRWRTCGRRPPCGGVDRNPQ